MILDGNDPSAIATAAQRPAQRCAAGPATETVYGWPPMPAATLPWRNFCNQGRPSDHPLIVHVADAAGIAHLPSDVPAFAQKLVDAFWPGPLTLILPRLSGVATATGGQDSRACAARPTGGARAAGGLRCARRCRRAR